ncbi:MAG: DUF4105 domain-containing protein [Proteobacteria bacterium]|nr:DUF4105 domain-containing protein [Pseudomonadota bacterium]
MSLLLHRFNSFFFMFSAQLFAWTLCLTSPTLQARDYIPAMPEDLTKVDFYLQSIGRGEDLYMTGGHSLLRIVDPVGHTDVVFNFGVFDFNEPGFIFKFLKGNINYRMAAYSMRDNIAMYQYERRSISQERINLTLLQRQAFMRALIKSAQPENLYFRYHYYFTNCATKAFDIIDAAVGGKLRPLFDHEPAQETLRDAVHESFNYYPMVGTALEIVMNSDLDVPMTALQDMFLPLRMQKRLQNVPQFDDSGNRIPGTRLLGEKTELLTYPPPLPIPYRGSQLIFVVLAPILILVIFLLMRKPGLKLPYRIGGLVGLIWGAYSAFFGVTMLLVWFATEHVHGSHSANLWLFWPIDILWIYLGFKWIKSGGPLYSRTLRRPLRIWLAGHMVLLAFASLLFVLGFIKQDVTNIWSELGPVTVLMCTASLFMLKERWEEPPKH